MPIKYYSNLYEIDDSYRKAKYLSLLLLSVKNDLQKWVESFSTASWSNQPITKYTSPDYNGTQFIIEIGQYNKIAYVIHANSPIKDRNSELISDEFNELITSIKLLRETIYTPEIYQLEKLIGNQHSRKEKLDSLDIEQSKEIIEETYQDWINNSSEMNARMISRIIYSYRRKEEIYNLWLEKFKDIKVITNLLNK